MSVRLAPTFLNAYLAPVLAQMEVPVIMTDSARMVSLTFERAAVPKEFWDPPLKMQPSMEKPSYKVTYTHTIIHQFRIFAIIKIEVSLN